MLGIGLMTYYCITYWPNAVAVGLFLIFGLVFIYGSYAGIQVLRRAENAHRHAVPFWAAQIPVFFSSHVSFQFICGGAAAVTINAEGILGFYPRVGSVFEFNLGLAQTTTIGVNVLALIIVVALLKDRKRSRASGLQESN